MDIDIKKVRFLAGLPALDESLEERAGVDPSVIREIAGLTDRNHHAAAYQMIATKVLKDKKLAKAFESVMSLHLYYGHMSPGLKAVRDDLYKRMKAGMKSKLSSSDYDAVYNSI